MIYLDATFCVRLYAEEPGFEKIRTVVEHAPSVSSSIIGKMETASALHGQLREGRISPAAYQEVTAQFSKDAADNLFRWLPLTNSIVNRVHQTFLDLPATVFLRTGDALHLATAAEAGFREIYSNDRHLLAAAGLFRLRGINPLAEKV